MWELKLYFYPSAGGFTKKKQKIKILCSKCSATPVNAVAKTTPHVRTPIRIVFIVPHNLSPSKGRAGHVMILSFSSRKSLFLNSYNYFQYNSGLGNTPYGKRDVPNRTCVGASLIPWIKAYIHPHLTVLPAYRSKARIVVFASRKAIPEFSSLCSP